jgi:hypothetical protein
MNRAVEETLPKYKGGAFTKYFSNAKFLFKKLLFAQLLEYI